MNVISGFVKATGPATSAAEAVAEAVAEAAVEAASAAEWAGVPTPPRLRVVEPTDSTVASVEVDGEVSEVLTGFGLAHVQTNDGTLYGINRQTPGIEFGALQNGQRVRCEVSQPFSRVLHARLLG